ncbi:radial spoke head 14 homolog [Takifugu flavidus]|nr:radial spoke head 14 homolog [Takifugu flavidus]
MDPSRAPVAFGRLAVPQLFAELQQPQEERRLPALASLCDLLHDPEHIHQTLNGGFLIQLKVLLQDEDPSVRTKVCELLHIISSHNIGRQALLVCSLLPPLCQLLDDSWSPCRRNVYQVLNRLCLLPAGAQELLQLVPKMMLKLQKGEEEEIQVLLLLTLTSCSRLDPGPALANDGISLLRHKLMHSSTSVRREAAAAMMALCVCEDGKQQVCKGAVLPVVSRLLWDEDIDVRVNAAGVIMYAVITTTGKQQCLDLELLPVLLDLVSQRNQEEDEGKLKRRKTLVVYCLQALASLAEAPDGRRILLEQLPRLVETSQAEDKDIRQAAQTAVKVVSWMP